MAVSDLWHRTLVYFGMADEADDYDDELDDDRYDEAQERRSSASAHEDLEQATASAPTSAASVRAPRPRLRRHLRRGGALQPADPMRSVESRPQPAEVHLIVPKSFNDAQQIADKFKGTIPVILNLQSAETDLAKRLIDFSSGLTYALDGGMQRVADKVFLLTPRNVEVGRGARPPSWRRASSTSTDGGAAGRLAGPRVRGGRRRDGPGARGGWCAATRAWRAARPRRRRPQRRSRRRWRTSGGRPASVEEAAGADLVCPRSSRRTPRPRRRDHARDGAGRRAPLGRGGPADRLAPPLLGGPRADDANLAVRHGGGRRPGDQGPRSGPRGRADRLPAPAGGRRPLPEGLFGPATALAGSGPGLLALVAEGLEEGAVAAGLSRPRGRGADGRRPGRHGRAARGRHRPGPAAPA